MSKMSRNIWIDLALVLLLGLTIASLGGADQEAEAARHGLRTHFHALLGIALLFGSLAHIWLHRQWIKAVLTGHSKGRLGIKLFMNSMVTVLMLLACLSGHEAMAPGIVSRFHSVTGSLALIGLLIHTVKHTGWMVRATIRLITEGRREIVGRAACLFLVPVLVMAATGCSRRFDPADADNRLISVLDQAANKEITPISGKKKGTGYVFGPHSPPPLPPCASIIATGYVAFQEKHSAAPFQEGSNTRGMGTNVRYNKDRGYAHAKSIELTGTCRRGCGPCSVR